MKLSIIIVNYNVRYFIEQCILSIKEATSSIDTEIIIVDNNSKDESCQMIKDCFPEIILIENKENKGFAAANNQGVLLAKGDFLCFLNPDTVLAFNTFIKILKIQKQLPHTGLLGPKLINGVGDFLHESKRNIPSPLTSFRRLFGIKIGYVKNYYADHIPSNSIGYVDVLVGAFMLIKKESYLSVGGFDEDYFIFGEDIDLAYKIKKKGLLNYYIGNVVAIHYRGESTDRNAVYVRQFYDAMRLFYKKHFRSNATLDFMVSVAIRLVSVIQSSKNFDKKKRIIERYCLITNDEGLYSKIASKLSAEVEILDGVGKEDLGDTNIEIIFDNNFISFGEIIDQMQKLRKDNITFKIRPKNCNYILGSDFSDGKGEVITF